MKARLFIVVVLVAAAAYVGRQVNGPAATAQPGRQEIHERYGLSPGARVEVRGINGPVEVKTADTEAAEVHVVTTASDEGALESRRVVVDHSPGEIVVRVEGSGGSFWGWLRGGGQVRQEVTLVLPRRVEFRAKGVNGPVSVGEVDGAVEVAGVNGRVEVAAASGRFEASGVNGTLKVGLPSLGGDGVRVRGVNGNIEVRLGAGVDADIEVRGHNGGVALDLPDVTSQEREGRRNLRARVGAGGPGIDISGVNGNIRFTSAAGAAAADIQAPLPVLAGPPAAPQIPAPPAP